MALRTIIRNNLHINEIINIRPFVDEDVRNHLGVATQGISTEFVRSLITHGWLCKKITIVGRDTYAIYESELEYWTNKPMYIQRPGTGEFLAPYITKYVKGASNW